MSIFNESSWDADAVGDKISKQLFGKKKKGKKDGKIKKLTSDSKIPTKNKKIAKKIKSNDNFKASVEHAKPMSKKTKLLSNSIGNKEPESSCSANIKSLSNVQRAEKKTAIVKHGKVRDKKQKRSRSNSAVPEELTPKKSKVNPGQNSQNIEGPKLFKNNKNKHNRSNEESDIPNKKTFLSKKNKTVINRKASKSIEGKHGEFVQSVQGKPLGNQETKSQRRRKKLKLKKIANALKAGHLKPENNTSQKCGGKSPIKSLDVQRLEMMLAQKEIKNSQKKKIYKEPESLRERMMSQLRASRFRFLNETLYNNESSESKKYFKEDPDAFAAYHSGYRQQVEQWPLNPLDVIISSIKKMSKDYVIADFGCGEARLAESVTQKVHSFDLVAINDRVKACDMARTPLLTNGVNVVVFCLSLMGTNLPDYLIEANRVLKADGILKIAEVESRFENVDEFIGLLGNYGFVNTWKDFSHNLFYFMDFKKTTEVSRKTKNLPELALKPCLYKKR